MVRTRQKNKGDNAEREIRDYLNEHLLDGEWKKMPGSGALGSNLGISILTGDLTGRIYGFPKPLKAECKAGYGNKLHPECKSLRVEKEWLDKIKEEAELAFAMPLFFGKFDNIRKGVKYFAALDIETFVELANFITSLRKELDKLYDDAQQ